MDKLINDSGSKIVYLLGAGASKNALPIVTEMPEAFSAQWQRLRVWNDRSTLGHLNGNSLDRYSAYLERMATWSRQYGTIDTYARSLFIRGEHQALDELKLHLTLFFVIEQAIHSFSALSRPAQNQYYKHDQIDTRYMGWLALLLERDSTINDRVKIISWNYDLQIDHAIALFKGFHDIGLTYSNEKVRIYPNLTDGSYSAEFADVVRLNGVAGLTTFPHGRRQLYTGVLGNDAGINELLRAIFSLYHQYDQREQLTLRCATETFTFAWENNATARESIRLAKNAMTHADIAVVIGYSFPSFNRNVDKALFQSFISPRESRKQIILQNPTLTPETFIQRVGLTQSSNLKVSSEQNLEQFYIPSQLF